jgi:hypothetical protein
MTDAQRAALKPGDVVLVRAALAGRLAAHEALPPEALERPWRAATAPSRRVLRSPAAAGLRPLPLRPERPRTLPQPAYKPVWTGQSRVAKGGL